MVDAVLEIFIILKFLLNLEFHKSSNVAHHITIICSYTVLLYCLIVASDIITITGNKLTD